MSWDYRIYKHKDNGEEWFALHEAYYGNDKQNPDTHTVEPATAIGSDPDELIAILKMQLRDAIKSKDSVIEYKK